MVDSEAAVSGSASSSEMQLQKGFWDGSESLILVEAFLKKIQLK